MYMDIKAAEEFISQIKSVISCKIIATNDNIEEIHILSTTKRNPKQISRDVQSGLISKFGLDIDYKKISIAQIDKAIINNTNFRLRLKTIEVLNLGKKVDIKVVLQKDDVLYEGRKIGLNTSYNIKRILAQSTLKAVEEFLKLEDSFIVEDIKTISLANKKAIVTAVSFVTEYEEQQFTGSAFIDRDIKEAVVKATLDAINRIIIRCYNGE
ncbi:hypothetical protein BET03_07925 [Thermohalobacter berrensis]|uniref:2-isopropylmalate synthase LeuA allosteric (dimerisation) domain-containing protein n=2 Tax=Thermohalobacter berrensis TaxID=99594 RepID=A0A419T9R4_9FIRM|nr:hypothetical protein BET03_07925 [Thermohalobacter berrensis]